MELVGVRAPGGVDWRAGVWTHPPVSAIEVGGDLLVTAAEASDAWRVTAYGFVHASEHALLAPLPLGKAVEVSFTAELPEQFDQAGVFARVDDEHWVKAGVERADGVLQVGAVVTNVVSDWSVAPTPGWSGTHVTVRASRTADALIIRARVPAQPWRLVRVAPLDASAEVLAGPYVCAPSRAGLSVRFHDWRVVSADESLH